MDSVQRLIPALLIAMVVAFGAPAIVTHAQDGEARLAHSNGQGTLKVGEEKFKISSVVVKLLPDQKAEITLVTDITVFLNATWSKHGDSQQEVDLQLVGGATASGLEGTGRLVLSTDGKAVASLSLKGSSKTSKRTVQADFEGK